MKALTRAAVAAAVAVSCGAAVAADAALVAAGRTKAQPCAVCHGPLGLTKMAQTPNLAGQPADYLAAQLKAFRDGKRPSEVMAVMAKPLSDADIAALAAWYESVEVEAKAPAK